MGQEGGDLILISGFLLLSQISLLKPKITQSWVSPQYKDDLAGVRALPRLVLPSSVTLLQTALSLFHPSVAIFSDVDFPFLEWVISNSAPRKASLVPQAKPVSPAVLRATETTRSHSLQRGASLPYFRLKHRLKFLHWKENITQRGAGLVLPTETPSVYAGT